MKFSSELYHKHTYIFSMSLFIIKSLIHGENTNPLHLNLYLSNKFFDKIKQDN
jgi:hypothetical protein